MYIEAQTNVCHHLQREWILCIALPDHLQDVNLIAVVICEFLYIGIVAESLQFVDTLDGDELALVNGVAEGIATIIEFRVALVHLQLRGGVDRAAKAEGYKHRYEIKTPMVGF